MINRYGLYKNSVPRYKIPTLKSSYMFDGESYGWWLPISDGNGNFYMVDTYHIKDGFLDYKTPADSFVEKAYKNEDMTCMFNDPDLDYKYGAAVLINDLTEDCFYQVCDLREFECTCDNIEDYEDEDKIYNVRLWYEQFYPYEVALLRKGAKKNPRKRINNHLNEILNEIGSGDCISRWKLKDAKRIAEEYQDPEISKKVNDLEMLVNKVDILENFKRRLVNEYRSNSGEVKDKNLTIIAIAGKAGIGKSTFSNLLRKKLIEKGYVSQIECDIIPFAKEIKNQAMVFGWDGNKDEKGRKLLQDLTKPIKNYHGQDYYAKVVYNEALREATKILIIDDLRFKSEVNFLNDLKEEGKCRLYTCKLEKDNFVSNLTKDAQNDISENDLNDYCFDHYIKNNGSLEDLEKETGDLIDLLGLQK